MDDWSGQASPNLGRAWWKWQWWQSQSCSIHAGSRNSTPRSCARNDTALQRGTTTSLPTRCIALSLPSPGYRPPPPLPYPPPLPKSNESNGIITCGKMKGLLLTLSAEDAKRQRWCGHLTIPPLLTGGCFKGCSKNLHDRIEILFNRPPHATHPSCLRYLILLVVSVPDID